MKQIKGTDCLIDKLLTGNEEITFNLIQRIREDEGAYNFASSHVHSKNLFLWENEEIVAMVNIAHQAKMYARINTVVTERKQRGKGYAKMLVGAVSQQLLEEHMIPMLYADGRNPSSNTTYQKIGYEKVGEIVELKVK